jgi:hypothetical protein
MTAEIDPLKHYEKAKKPGNGLLLFELRQLLIF